MTEGFDRESVVEIGYIDLLKGGFKEVQPRLRVQVYDLPSMAYGPIIIVYDGFVPRNPRQSKPLAQIHLTEEHAIQTIAMLVKALKAYRPTLTVRDIFSRVADLARRL